MLVSAHRYTRITYSWRWKHREDSLQCRKLSASFVVAGDDTDVVVGDDTDVLAGDDTDVVLLFHHLSPEKHNYL